MKILPVLHKNVIPLTIDLLAPQAIQKPKLEFMLMTNEKHSKTVETWLLKSWFQRSTYFFFNVFIRYTRHIQFPLVPAIRWRHMCVRFFLFFFSISFIYFTCILLLNNLFIWSRRLAGRWRHESVNLEELPFSFTEKFTKREKRKKKQHSSLGWLWKIETWLLEVERKDEQGIRSSPIK